MNKLDLLGMLAPQDLYLYIYISADAMVDERVRRSAARACSTAGWEKGEAALKQLNQIPIDWLSSK